MGGVEIGWTGTPVDLGGCGEEDHFDTLLTAFGPNGPYVVPPRSVEEILRVAAGISFPDHLVKRKKSDAEDYIRMSQGSIENETDVRPTACMPPP